MLRSSLRTRPDLKRCLTRCRHCGIYFLTNPRNAGREDIGCPFGCRDAHRRKNSTKRSVEYYRTKEGKIKKQIQNERRRNNSGPGNSDKDTDSGEVESGFDAEIVGYIQMVAGLIEGRVVSRGEILEVLERRMRQQGMYKEREILYAVKHLGVLPP